MIFGTWRSYFISWQIFENKVWCPVSKKIRRYFHFLLSLAYPIDRLDWSLFSAVIVFYHWFPLLDKIEIGVYILPCNFPAILIIFTGRGRAGNPPFPTVRDGAGNPPLPTARDGAGNPPFPAGRGVHPWSLPSGVISYNWFYLAKYVLLPPLLTAVLVDSLNFSQPFLRFWTWKSSQYTRHSWPQYFSQDFNST